MGLEAHQLLMVIFTYGYDGYVNKSCGHWCLWVILDHDFDKPELPMDTRPEMWFSANQAERKQRQSQMELPKNPA